MKIIIFSALWCPSCLIMVSRYQRLKEEFSHLEFIEYDFDTNKDEATKYKPGKILPTLIVLNQKDEEVTRVVGEKSYKKLKHFINDIKNE